MLLWYKRKIRSILLNELYFAMDLYFITYNNTSCFGKSIPYQSIIAPVDFSIDGESGFCISVSISDNATKFYIKSHRFCNIFYGKVAIHFPATIVINRFVFCSNESDLGILN